MTPPLFRYRDFTLADAIDALKAYDHGCLDSGIRDEDMRAAVRSYLIGLDEDARLAAVAEVASGYLTPEMAALGYGAEDVTELHEWIEELLR